MRSKPLLLISTALISTFLSMPLAAQQAPASNTPNLARVEVRFAALEERLRQMQGKIEEVEFENRRLRERLDLFQQDAELRFGELESGNMGGAAAASAASATETPAESPAAAATPSDTQTLRVPKEGGAFESPRDHYNHAFRLLNQTQYAEAGASFESFIASYPKDPLVGNAYYWAGETQYVRQNYPQAAEFFRRGYESLPEGPKAGDNLLKLAMSLSAIDRKTEACVVLKQVAVKFGGNSTSLKTKAETERNRIGCK